MWMKVDDKLHVHRKTRTILRSNSEKRRDVGPMGLWVVAGSWAGQNETDGWVPEDELERWDDDWQDYAERLVKSGYWRPQERGGEPGFGFCDWHDYNPSSNASAAGAWGNHVRWHVEKGVVNPECEHCPKEPDEADTPPDDDESSGATRTRLAPDIAPESGVDIAPDSQNIAPPDPTRPDPNKTCASTDVERDFDEWYSSYPLKRGRGQAARAYKAARKKADHRTLVAALARQLPELIARPKYIPYPATWLNGERWADQVDNVHQLPIQSSDEGAPWMRGGA